MELHRGPATVASRCMEGCRCVAGAQRRARRALPATSAPAFCNTMRPMWLRAQTRLRFGKGSNAVEYKGTIDCLLQIYKTEGRRGLYRGMETKLWHSTLISALMFLSYEKIQLAVERVRADREVEP